MSLGSADDDESPTDRDASRDAALQPLGAADEFIFTYRQAGQLADLLFFAHSLLEREDAALEVHAITRPALPPGQRDWMRFEYVSEAKVRLDRQTLHPTIPVPRPGFDEDEIDLPSLTARFVVVERPPRRVPPALWPLAIARDRTQTISWWWYNRARHTRLSPYNAAYNAQLESVTFSDFPNLLDVNDSFELTTSFGYDYVRRPSIDHARRAFVFYADAEKFGMDVVPALNFFNEPSIAYPPVGAVFLYVPQPRLERAAREQLVDILRANVRTNDALARVWRAIIYERQQSLFAQQPATE
jgi:hypothetical protein